MHPRGRAARACDLRLAVLAIAALCGAALAGPGTRPSTRPKPVPRLEIPAVARDEAICFALYTVQNATLKLTAQLYPLARDEERTLALDVKLDGAWKEVSRVPVVERGWTAHFRVEKWDASRSVEYRLRHAAGAQYTGLVRRDPMDKPTIVVAAFTGNGNNDRGPRPDIIANIKSQDPDLLFFSGDQVYDHGQHLAAWLLFGRQFGDIIRDRPTVTIPDDHDVGQGNLWGAGGKKSNKGSGDDGGYVYPPDFVNEVQRAQTSHLPDPFDPTPIERGIGVYYTALSVGGVSFAIIEDRKWKTGPDGVVPKGLGPRPDHVAKADFDPSTVDLPGAQLLGERQLKFLDAWGQDWRGADMKAVLSQTVLAGAAHYHGKHGYSLVADLDSNGWPQSGRNAALRAIRRSLAVMICGDQHLGTVIQHGIQDWDDAGFSFCVPSIVNYYGRWWMPDRPGNNRKEGPLPLTGQYKDGLGNRITMHAYANPAPDNRMAAGYGLVRFDRKTRRITFECWGRQTDVTRPDAKQFPGWPITIRQEDNDPRKAAAFLPTLQIVGPADPVVAVIDEANGELLYTLRILGNTFRPKVFRQGLYTIQVGEGPSRKTLRGIRALPDGATDVLRVEL